ncbi:male sterility protein [Tricladium varicosporioides]|nr:male sterility protein [Hymenoscyphus varicosporioides]
MTEIYEFYKQQVVFLTGATGGLGGCLLYKLSIVLDVQRLYVLIRGSESRALERWKHTMLQQFRHIEDRISTRNIVLVPGDMTKERLGIAVETLCTIEKEVTIIINAAANISFRAPLLKVVLDNCLPALQLAALAVKMTRLQHFVQVSSAYANSFLPDGPVDEKVYYLSSPDDAEGELEEILRTGTTRYLQGFPWAYAYSKQLMERLMTARFPNLPILLLRPTSIGPAIAQPYEMYGPQGSCPISTLYARLMQPTGGKSVWYAPTHGHNILDEVPVDLVANVLLQHVHSGTRGVVHASSSYYIPKTLEWILEQPFNYLPPHWTARMATPVFVQDKRVKESKEAKFYRIGSRAWEFRAPSSRCLGILDGPLKLGLSDHNIDRFVELRIRSIFYQNFGGEEYPIQKAEGVGQRTIALAKL